MRADARTRRFHVPLEPVLPLLAAHGIAVRDPVQGFAVCPGIELHTTENGARDCIVFNNRGTPHIHCFHQSCRSVRDTLNAELRRAAKDQKITRARSVATSAPSGGQRAYETAGAQDGRERKLAASAVPVILQDYHWPVDAIVADSPVAIDLPATRHWQYILGMFPAGDVIWIGRDKRDSGSPRLRHRFRTAGQWLSAPSCPGAFVCPNAFRPEVYERFIEYVLSPRFLVLESDDALNRDQVGAVFRWVESSLNLRLRAVVDSGNKSLHGWFEYPSPEIFQKLRQWLPAMGCDPALFILNQPSRLPGAWRPETSRYQRLLYLA